MEDKSRPLFGLSVSTLTFSETVEHLCQKIKNRESCRVVAFNTNKLHKMEESLLKKSLQNADLIISDGMSIVWASRILPGEKIPERVTGCDLFQALVKESNKRGYSPYFFGAQEEILQKMLTNLKEKYPELNMAGARNGYFDKEELPRIIEQINNSRPDILFIGISSPMKEEIMQEYANELQVPVIMGVGGSFDVVAGKISRSPKIFQKTGLEWLHRLAKEPTRLWKRYLIANTYFAYRLIKELSPL
jgi:N-acetylglucosaminyldiphosphoundecaprenol N-acetyl-beta-D-mannosaminyltransferase